MDSAVCDTVAFTSTPTNVVLFDFVARMKERWPKLTIDLACVGAESTSLGTRISSAKACIRRIADEPHVVLFFFRDVEMRRYFRLHHWMLQPCGEGTFSVHFHRRKDVRIELLETRGDALSAWPCPTWLACKEILEIALVSPGDPAADPFSKEIWKTLLSCM